MPEKSYDARQIELKWSERWKNSDLFQAEENSSKPKYYVLEMLPYPSGQLHIGHLRNYTIGDALARYKRMRGFNVLHPMGWDAFGLPAENAAIANKRDPYEWTMFNIENMKRQHRRMGFSYDWSREIATCDPEYYRWNQWFFLKMLERGLAYRKRSLVNWCNECGTVLANEQVVDGCCWRHESTPVEQRAIEQWFLRITNYADELLASMREIEAGWPERVLLMQRNWIGRSEGAEVDFHLDGTGAPIRVFTTRIDTIYGATCVILAPEHPLVAEIASDDVRAQAKHMIDARAAKGPGDIEKEGINTHRFAVNPFSGEKVPIWIGNFVLMGYGTGAIMAVPGHDARDFEFAVRMKLPIVRVVAGPGQDASTPLAAAEPDIPDGRLVNSPGYDGRPWEEAKRAITDALAARGLAKPVVNYRLHDWCISRQRYWGPPIPIIYCDACGTVPVPEQDLPVVLPALEDFRPDDSGVSPLARAEAWYRVPCPRCGKRARRETDVSDTFLDSAWYFLRYPSADRDDVPFDAALTRKWLPVASYIGGNEHAVLHLMYARFITMALKDLGHVPFAEPFARFRAHGTIVKDGAKMSKSRGNVVNPDQYVEQWGADTFRMYLMFLGPYQEGGDFRDAGISGIRRFLDKVWGLVDAVSGARGPGSGPPPSDPGSRNPDPALVRAMHRTIQKVTADTASLDYNTAIAAMMEYVNALRDGSPTRELLEPLVVLLAPYAPHFAEECWERLAHATSVMDAGLPACDPALAVADEVEFVVQVNGRVRGRLRLARGTGQEAAVQAALADPAVARFTGGAAPRKVVFVPDRLVNLVI